MWENNINSSTWWNENNPNRKQPSVFWEVKNKKILLLRILDEWDKNPEIINIFLAKYKNIISSVMLINELIEISISYRWEELIEGVVKSINPIRKFNNNLEKMRKDIRSRILQRMHQLWLWEYIKKTTHRSDSNDIVTTTPETITINQDMLKALGNMKSTQNKT